MPACDQCQNPMLKGIHTCGIDGPQSVAPDGQNILDAALQFMKRSQDSDPIEVLTSLMNGQPQGVQFGCTCGSSGSHIPPCPFASAPLPTPGFQLTGWTCSVCGGGVAPMVQRCPCRPLPALFVGLVPPIIKGV